MSTHQLWFEREILPDVAPEIAERCTVLGPGSPGDPFAGIEAAEGVIAGSYRYDATVMDLAPHLRVIARTGIGVDSVDLTAATERGIAVCNTPDAPTVSTAEHTVALVLAAAKNLKVSEARLRGGDDDLYGGHEAIELDGKVLGLVGFGRIARRVATAAAALGMEIHAFDPYLETAPDDVVLHDSRDDLLAIADVVSLHLPLDEDTAGSFGAAAFAAMKPGSVFVNAARGGIVDQRALLAALDRGHLFAAGLDVTDPEPLPVDHPLLARDDVVVTPHVAFGTGAGKRRLLRSAVEQALLVLDEGSAPHIVNPEVRQQASTALEV